MDLNWYVIVLCVIAVTLAYVCFNFLRIRKMPEGDVTVEVGSNFQTTITCENSVFHIVGKDTTEFSPLPVIDRKTEVVLTQFQLREMIRQTIFSISPNDTGSRSAG